MEPKTLRYRFTLSLSLSSDIMSHKYATLPQRTEFAFHPKFNICIIIHFLHYDYAILSSSACSGKKSKYFFYLKLFFLVNVDTNEKFAIVFVFVFISPTLKLYAFTDFFKLFFGSLTISPWQHQSISELVIS